MEKQATDILWIGLLDKGNTVQVILLAQMMTYSFIMKSECVV